MAKANMVIKLDISDLAEEFEKAGYTQVIRCRDCRHFSVKDHWGKINGVPILGASDVPTCDAWANTECMVDPDGYCFLGDRKEGIEDAAGCARGSQETCKS